MDLELIHLHCYGCAHSAAQAPFPGQPSGERPCCFCIRNGCREAWIAQLKAENDGVIPEYHPVNGIWYDKSLAVKVPMDCYHSCDMKEQFQKWMDAATLSADSAQGV